MIPATQPLPITVLPAHACLSIVLLIGLAASCASAAEPAGDDAPIVSLEQQLLAEPLAQLAAAARAEGDPAKGAALFYQPQMACLRCHTTGRGDSPLGPDLAKLPTEVTAEHLIESVLAPSKQVRRGYEPTVLELDDGTALTAFVVEENHARLVVRDVGQNGRRRTIPLAQIAQRERSALSAMPTGQVNLLRNRQQFLDLAAYLIAIAEQGPDRAIALHPVGAPLGPPPIAPDTSASQPQVYRTLMPESGAASLAIGLGHGVWVCFDPQRGGVNYAWRGGLDLSPTVAQKINQPAAIEGDLFFVDATPVPLRTTSSAARPRVQFRGYRLDRKRVTLRYQMGDLAVNETLEALPTGTGFVRHFKFTAANGPVWIQVDPQKQCNVTVEPAVPEKDRFRLEPDKNDRVTMRIEAAEVKP